MASTNITDMAGALSPLTLHSAAAHQAQIVESGVPHRRYAVSVTNQHGLQIEEIDDVDTYAEPPARPEGTRTVADLESFLAELSRRGLGESGTLWGNATRGNLTAVYNDHTDEPGWRDDKLALQLTQDPDWLAWHALSGEFYGQETFGDKIEELLHTVISPDQADLLEIIDSVRASTSGQFESRIQRADGSQKLVYSQEHSVRAGRTGELEVPQTISLELRPWENHPEVYPVEAYFRVRVADGRLHLAVKLKPTRQIVRAAWADLANRVTEHTAKPVYAVS